MYPTAPDFSANFAAYIAFGITATAFSQKDLKMRKVVIALILSYSAVCAMGQPNTPMRFKVDRACDGNGEMCGSRIYAEGVIQPDTPDNFVAFVRQNRTKLPPSPTVSLDSPGGNMFAGIKLGQAIRRLAFDTEILDRQTCASACALAFLGGAERSLDTNGRFGVHQFSSAIGNVGDSLTQATIVAVASYIESMGVDRKLLDVASLIPPASIYWLTDEQRQQLRVDNSQTIYSDWILDSDQAGNPYTQATLSLEGDRLRANYMIRRTGQDVTLRIHLTVPAHKVDRLSNVDAFLQNQPMHLSLDGKSVFESPPMRWQATKTTMTTEVRLPRNVIARVRNSERIGFDFFIPRVASDMDPSFVTPSPALGRFIATLLR